MNTARNSKRENRPVIAYDDKNSEPGKGSFPEIANSDKNNQSPPNVTAAWFRTFEIGLKKKQIKK